MLILNICDVPAVMEVLRIVNIAITIIRIVVPILLIIGAMIDLVKAVMNAELNKISKPIVNKVIAAVIVFLIPTFVSVIALIAGNNGEYKHCVSSISTEQIRYAYYETANDLIDKAQETMSIDDYNAAYAYLINIKDEDMRKELSDKLEAIKEEIDKNERNNNNNNNGGSNQGGLVEPTSPTGNPKADQGGNSDCNKNGKYQQCSPKKGVFGSFPYYDSEPNSTKNRNSLEMDPKWKKENFTWLETKCSNGKKYNWYINVHAKSIWKQVQERLCQITTTGIDGIVYSPDEIVFDGTTVIRFMTNKKSISNHAYGTAIDLNAGASYTINGKSYVPYQRKKDVYENFCNAIGGENDKRNVNYILWIKIFKPLGFIWGGNWSGNSFDGMHYEIDWKKLK